MALAQVVLIRHAKAEGAHPDGDVARALSPEGLRRVASLLTRIDRQAFRPELALSSPYLRARQTREGFQAVMPGAVWRESAAFTPGAEPDDAWDELTALEAEGFSRVAIFTHNPLVTLLAEVLLASAARDLVFHTPTLVSVGFPSGFKKGAGRFEWTLSS